jgi:glutathione S-transferase
MKLINNRPSPFGRKVMIALKEKAIPFTIEWDIPWHRDTTVPKFNPLEQLPILVTDSGEVVYESSYILAWLEHHHPEPSLTPDDPRDLLRMELYKTLSVGVMDAIIRVNFELARSAECQSKEWMDRQKRKIIGGLGELDRLIDNRPFALADRLTLADLEVASILGHLDFIAEKIPPLTRIFAEEIPWKSRFPGLVNYIAGLEERQSFRESTPAMVEIDFQSVMA